MARTSVSIEQLVAHAVAQSIRKVVPAIQRHVALLAAAELERSLSIEGRPRRRHGRRLRPEDIARWVADGNARRVPKFVIEATGLDTKKKIVARYGPGVVFEKGGALPRPLRT